MPVRIKAPKKAGAKHSGLVRFLLHPAGKAILATALCLFTLAAITGVYFYVKYSRLIEAKLESPFDKTALILAAPRTVMVGDADSPQELASGLRRAGYSESRANRVGHYAITADGLEVYPGPDSYFKRDDAVIKFNGNKIARIISLADNTDRTQYQLEPAVISNLFDKHREKRRLVKFEDIPPLLVHAVISAEDKRFFQHSGFDPIRIMKSAYIDLRRGRNAEGASTLSMQLAGMLFLDRSERTWRRKIPEVLITLDLEQRLSKQQIFEYYANQVPLGQRGSFSIRGFGEAAQVYFGKDLKHLTLPEAATLAGLVQRPSYSNPFRWPERAKARRNIVLKLMNENGYITPTEYVTAAASPMVVEKRGMESTEAPYFVDLVNDRLNEDFSDYDFQTNGYRIYTTLDSDLQHDAAEAVRIGMDEVDKQMRRRKKRNPNYPDPQVALIALDPQTGDVKALVGGRNYGVSQLNHAVAKRQPGSSFKAFVYAAAMNTGLAGSPPVLTPATTINDEPTTFWFDSKPYQPANFKHEYYGTITLRDALAHSSNVAAVRVAEETGYGAVVDLARRAGLNMDIRPTPSVALGSYEVTPLEIAGGYTIFDDRGIWSKPNFISGITDEHGRNVYESKPQHRTVLDPRVAFLMDSMLEQVVQTGTGAGIRARGINFPVAGKTGTSHDGWFAGFSSKLICVVWVGFDDNRQLDLEGAHSALPIWAEFMKRAHQHRQYRDVSEFEPPAGVVSAQIDPLSGDLATPGCPSQRTEYFIDGTQPVQSCPLHGGGAMQVASWDMAPPAAAAASNAPGTPAVPAVNTRPQNLPPLQRPRGITGEAVPPSNSPAVPPPEKKKGIFGRIRDIFR